MPPSRTPGTETTIADIVSCHPNPETNRNMARIMTSVGIIRRDEYEEEHEPLATEFEVDESETGKEGQDSLAGL